MDLLDVGKLERMLHAKRVAEHLTASLSNYERQEFEREAQRLSQDICQHVRSVNAHELCKVDRLPDSLIKRICKDVQDVSTDFLIKARSLSDKYLACLIPSLKPYGQVAVAQRRELGAATTDALALYGSAESVTRLVRDDDFRLLDRTVRNIVERFQGNRIVMDNLSARPDLSDGMIDILADHVSSHCKKALRMAHADTIIPADTVALLKTEALWSSVSDASSRQIFAIVSDLKRDGKLTHQITIEMAKRGSHAFFESALALFSGCPLGTVRSILRAHQPREFADLMRRSGVRRADLRGYIQATNVLYDPLKREIPLAC